VALGCGLVGIRSIEQILLGSERIVRLFLAFLLCLYAAGASAQPSGRPAVPVEAAKVATGTLSERVTAVGSLSSNESVIVRPEIAGRVVEIGFQEGQPVKKGDLLIKLDDSLNRAELAEAEARLELAKRNFKRIDELYSGKVATARSLDEARSNLDVGTAAVELAKVKLAKTRIIAPFDGIAGLRQVSVGDYVTAGEDLFNLEEIDPVKANFRVAEKFLSAIRTGQAIEITVDAYPGRSFKGEVYAIDPRIDAAGRSVVIRARVDNSERLLRPGLFARVTLILDLKTNALTVPEQAIVPRGDDQFVYRVIDGKAKQTKVMIGTRRDGRVEIVEGLSVDDVVVTAGQQKIRDGASVRVINDAASAKGEGTDRSASTTGKGA
jgi:membrane fusion protein (multidrug efflux system)